MIEGDVENPIFKVRLIVGDTESVLVSDNVIAFALDTFDYDVDKAAIKVLEYIVSYLSSLTTHQVGDVFLDAQRLYKQKKDLLNRLKVDPRFKLGSATITQIVGADFSKSIIE